MSDLDVVLATVIQCVQEDAAKHQYVNNYYPAAFHVQKSAKFLHWTHFVELGSLHMAYPEREGLNDHYTQPVECFLLV